MPRKARVLEERTIIIMPSTRRIKLFGLIMAFFILLILYFTADARHARSHDFYTSTVKAMDAKAAAAAKDVESVDVGQRLRDAETAAKKAADAKTPKPASIAEKEVPIVGGGEDVGKNVAGRVKVKGAGEKWDMGTGKDGQGGGKEETVQTQEEHDVEIELNAILKRSPSRSLPFFLFPLLRNGAQDLYMVAC